MWKETFEVKSFSPQEIEKQESFRKFLNTLEIGKYNSPDGWESTALQKIEKIKEEARSSYGTKEFDDAYAAGNDLQKAVYNEVVRERLQNVDRYDLMEIVFDPKCSIVIRKWAKTLLDAEEDIDYKGKSIFSPIAQGESRAEDVKRDREYYRRNPEELLAAIREPQNFYLPSMDAAAKEDVDYLCQKIQDNLWKDDEYVTGSGELLPEYRELLEKGDYCNVEEMCNVEGVNISDVYDFEPKRYSDEFKRGFIDFVKDDSPSPWDADVAETCNDAYFTGLEMAEQLVGLLDS